MEGAGIQLLFGVVFAVIVGAVANSKGRNAVGWAAVGFFLGCIGLIIVLVLPDLNVERRRRDAARDDRRRLREELRQERMKTEAYRRHVSARLDAHDEHLGLDTRGTTALPEGHGHHPSGQLGAGAAPFVGSTPPPDSGPKEWFYERGGESRGPVSAGAIRLGLQKGRIDGTTLVWREGMPNWQALSEVREFASAFRG